MGKKLVIVESPAKAKTINKILGNEFVVKSSVGHVRDLPVKNMGVDIKDSFRPRYVLVAGKNKIIQELKKATAASDSVYLAPDPDREGEAIAWHLRTLLEKGNAGKPFHRVQFNEITPTAVRRAFETPGDIDMHRVDAQQARRVLDRLVGYMVSPMLWRRLQRGLSAGRVQSVALRLVCEREQVITAFVPEPFWLMGARVHKLIAPVDPFDVKLIRINDQKADIKTAEDAERIRRELEGRALRVEDVKTREISRRPAPPYITSTLQQAGSSAHGYSPSRTMSIAQKLYEGVDLGDGPIGLITYMRTDSFTVSNDSLDACRQLIRESYGAAYCPEAPNLYKSRAGAQGAHEAIRPTDVTRTPESVAQRLDSTELKIYTLIWKRFVASQMTPARIEQRTVQIDAPPGPSQTDRYLFQATASEVKFPGYMKLSGVEIPAEKEEAEGQNGEAQALPELTPGERLECLEWLTERKETQPPARYSETSLIATLEKNGVGRPSTYAQIISTLLLRRYVTGKRRILAPTPLGMQVSDLLVLSLGQLFNVEFTASMEASLDEVENGHVKWEQMIKDFYEKFEKWMELTKAPAADRDAVARVLTVLERVQSWAPDVKRGKRVYSDKGFVESLRQQLVEGAKEISERQLETLLRIACHYREQVPELDAVIVGSGYERFLTDTSLQPPSPLTVRKLDLLDKTTMDESARRFVDSLRARISGNRCLTIAQLAALNNIVVSHAKQIDGFDAIRETLELGTAVADTDDTESGILLPAMQAVTVWKEPVKRGKRVFDDHAFYESLSQHFERKGFLSPRQRAALKKMVKRYKEQIPNYDEMAERCGMASKT